MEMREGQYQSTVSVDLTSRRYVDIGIAVLNEAGAGINVELIQPSELGLIGVPNPRILAERLCTFAGE